jgi:pimeloyl-ACP methyl ester carboxylesterase
MKTKWHSDKIKVDGLNVHYYRTGADKPTLILSHGATDNGLCWRRVAAEMEASYDLIMYDARGHGLTEIVSDDQHTRDMAEDLANLTQALGLKKPRFMGHSMGAATTLALAAAYPDLPRCIVLEEPPLRALFDKRSDAERQAHAEAWYQRIREMKHLPYERMIAREREEHPKWAEVEWEPWAEAKKQVDLEVLIAAFRVERSPWQELLAKVTCPVLIIYGEETLGAIVSDVEAREAQRILGDQGEVLQIKGAGHNVRREQFQTFMNVVTRFLRDCPNP